MRRSIAVLFLFALCLPAGAQAADPKSDPACLYGCPKTDIAKEAAKAMKEAPGAALTHAPAQEIVRAIEKEIATEKRPAAAPAPKAGDAYSQQETCSPYAAQQLDMRRQLQEYEAQLKIEQERIRQEHIAYAAKLRADDAANKIKMAEMAAKFAEGQREQAAASVRYQEELAGQSAAFAAKVAVYHDELAAAQGLMRCPPWEYYNKRFQKDGDYTTKWKP